MGFKDFVEQTVTTTEGVYNLNRGIPHLENLPPSQFLDVIENIAIYTITEKLDGANLVFGFAVNGTPYTSRQTKGGKLHYKVESYSNRPANNGFKQAHLALIKEEAALRGVIGNGEAVEVEVLYGRQPNAIVYGSNQIAFLRMVPGSNGEAPDQTKIAKLKETMEGISVFVSTNATVTRDGIDLYEEAVTESWTFAVAPTIDPIKFVAVDLATLDVYKNWLKVRVWPGITNEDIFNCKLNRIRKDDLPEGVTKDILKEAREKVREIVLEQHLRFKACFVDLLRKLEPTFRDVHLEGTERNIGIEGVVLRHPETEAQIKIVDKENFTAINQFNHAIRNEIRATSNVPNRFDATLGRDIDIYTELLHEVADIVGIPGLRRLSNIKRVIRNHTGNNLTETTSNFASAFGLKDVDILRERLSRAIHSTMLDLAFCHGKYLLERHSYAYTLPTGRTIRYTDEINKRTELMFAETRKELKEMRSQVEFAETLEDIAQALYGKQLNSL